MPIQILPARLANQIAAGEVVERPASVIKELVENSLDAGATVIEIDIEKGGSKLIRIRDNGCGIAKQELTLALSRHATSKVSSFDDLENITSLGFRGEALASISSVARLKLTSKPADQSEAWQAYAEGRDMSVTIVPAAHPDGTTIEVVDLFFNTPARRKFMRTEKTEFYHIDELIKRIALSRFDVQFSLKHNGKSIRHLRPADSDQQKDRRISQICGKSFIESVVRVQCDYDGVSLCGWIAEPRGCRNQNDVQFSYVNGRMMRDKLINHAIRQAYGQQLSESQYPTYVLFLTVNPRQIDVNVHPAKHEVRFHEARLIHDFIVQALEKAINPVTEFEYAIDQTDQSGSMVNEAAPATELYPGQNTSAQRPLQSPIQSSGPSQQASNMGFSPQTGYQNKQPSRKELDSYHQALSSFSEPIKNAEPVVVPVMPVTSNTDTAVQSKPSKRACLSVINDHFALYQIEQNVYLLDLNKVNGKVVSVQYSEGLIAQPLLLPVKMVMDKSVLSWLEQQITLLNRLGIEFECMPRAVVIRKVPAIIRNANVSDILSTLFDWLEPLTQNAPDSLLSSALEWLFSHYDTDKCFDLMTATNAINRCLAAMSEQQLIDSFAVQIDLSAYMDKLANGSLSE